MPCLLPEMNNQSASAEAAPHPTQPCNNAQHPLPSGAMPADLLFAGKQEILISHNGEIYRLRITRNAKLILTK